MSELPPKSLPPSLSGATVLVTRPRRQAGGIRERLERLGAEVFVQPAIEIAPPDDWSKVDDAVARLDEFDWLVFSSANGVGFLLERIRLLGNADPARRLLGVKLAAMGPATADELAKYNLRADLIPGEYRAEALADELAKVISRSPAAKRFLLARASRGRAILAERLTAAGGMVEEIVVYSSRDVAADSPEVEQVAEKMSAAGIDWVTVTSSAIARSLIRMFGEGLRRTKLASISPVTSDALVELGFEPAAEASRYTIDGLVEAIIEAESKGENLAVVQE